MYTIAVSNVNEAYCQAVMLLNNFGEEVSPRGVKTIELDRPVVTEFTKPWQRVCLIPERDANPFFHLFESLWILAGSDDAVWLSQFNSQMINYSDDGMTFNAAYGHRLRYAIDHDEFSFDQIPELLELMYNDPNSRRGVLQIWNAYLDLNENSKDIPCNTVAFFKIRKGRLNMTVCCRSNDMIWGAYGANVVQFSMLQEYIANKLKVGIGTYRQISDSFHIYPDNPKWEALSKLPMTDFNPYRYDVRSFPIAADHYYWDTDLHTFMEIAASPFNRNYEVLKSDVYTPYFERVVLPMLHTWAVHKQYGRGLKVADTIEAEDWRAAAKLWLSKREEV